METLNYVRQCSMYFDNLFKKYANNKDVDIVPEALNRLTDILNTAKKAVKFIIPEEGKIFDDGLKGMPDELNLPYPTTVIEFSRKPTQEDFDNVVTCNGDLITKIISVATQVKNNEIDIKCFVYSQNMVEWILLPFAAKISTEKRDEIIDSKKHYVTSNNYLLCVEYETIAETFITNSLESIDDQMKRQLHYPIHAVLELIEALTCSNITQTSLKNNKPIKKGAYSFDEYKVLVIKAGNISNEIFTENERIGTSPREHLRRGHTRTYASGLKIWIQSMTVNAGVGGKILKEYYVENIAIKTDSSLVH